MTAALVLLLALEIGGIVVDCDTGVPVPEQFTIEQEARGQAAAINDIRQAEGLPRLYFDLALSVGAWQWAQQMAIAGAISHDALALPILAEAVGAGPSFAAILAAYLQSPSHRDVLLLTDTSVGPVGRLAVATFADGERVYSVVRLAL